MKGAQRAPLRQRLPLCLTERRTIFVPAPHAETLPRCNSTARTRSMAKKCACKRSPEACTTVVKLHVCCQTPYIHLYANS